MKTPEQETEFKKLREQAENHVFHNYSESDFNEHTWDRTAADVYLDGYYAGYQAAKDEEAYRSQQAQEQMDAAISRMQERVSAWWMKDDEK